MTDGEEKIDGHTTAEQRHDRIKVLELTKYLLTQPPPRAPEKADLIMAIAVSSAGIGDLFADALWAVAVHGNGLPIFEAIDEAIKRTKELA